MILPPEQVHEREAARFASLFAPEMEPSLQSWLSGFRRAVVFAATPDEVLLGNLAAVIPRVQHRGHPPRPGVVTNWWAVGRWSSWSAWAWLVRFRRLTPLVEPPPEPGGALLAPGSGGKAKRLAPERAALLARRLVAEHAWLTLVLGPAEEAAYRADLALALEGVAHRVLADAPYSRAGPRSAGRVHVCGGRTAE